MLTRRYIVFKALLDLIEANFTNQIIDLSQVELNKLESTGIETQFFDEISASDFANLKTTVNLDSIKTFFFRNDLITYIPDDLFSCFKNLFSLTLKVTDIECLSNVFQMENLIELDLSGCNLSRLKDNIFNDLKNLKNLNLSFNRLKTFNKKTFNGLVNLEILNLNKNQIHSFEKNALSNLKKLKNLLIEKNKILHLTHGMFSGLNKLEKLSLNGKEIKTIDQRVFQQCRIMEVLDLSENKFSQELHPFLFRFNKNLKYLNMKKCSPSGLECLNRLTQLEYLDLTGDCLKIDEFYKIEIKSLKFLMLTCSDIPKFGKIFKELRALEIVGVENFPEGCLKFLQNLEYLHINFNKCLNKLNDEHFKGPVDLKYLNMSTTHPDDNLTSFRNIQLAERLFIHSNDVEINTTNRYMELIDKTSFYSDQPILCYKDFYLKNILNVSNSVKNSI
ncbi:unnamed protein product [Brachionus calyciflorus]|uniref:Uncharacterized protein n=1 Tax=Brachionus calyciflorus TaxID=104777 RepID=A0A814HXL9_9BILA|nr:unnamed protein product [Brachionus calyciflorus]